MADKPNEADRAKANEADKAKTDEANKAIMLAKADVANMPNKPDELKVNEANKAIMAMLDIDNVCNELLLFTVKLVH